MKRASLCATVALSIAAASTSTAASANCSVWRGKPVLATIWWGTKDGVDRVTCLGTANVVSSTPTMFESEIVFGPEQEGRGPMYKCVTEEDGVQLSGVIRARFLQAPAYCDVRFITDRTFFLAPGQTRKSVEAYAYGSAMTPIVGGQNKVDGADHETVWSVGLNGWRDAPE